MYLYTLYNTFTKNFLITFYKMNSRTRRRKYTEKLGLGRLVGVSCLLQMIPQLQKHMFEIEYFPHIVLTNDLCLLPVLYVF